MSEQIADGTVETPSVEDLQAKLAKAEAKIVELKTKPSETEPKKEEEAPVETEEETKKDEVVEESLDDKIARAVAAATIANNNVTANNMSMSGTPAPSESFSLKTVDEYKGMPYSEQVKYMNSCIEKTGDFTFDTGE